MNNVQNLNRKSQTACNILREALKVAEEKNAKVAPVSLLTEENDVMTIHSVSGSGALAIIGYSVDDYVRERMRR